MNFCGHLNIYLKSLKFAKLRLLRTSLFCSVTSVYICCLKSIKPFFCWEFHVDFKTTSRWLSYHFVCFVQYLKFPMSVSSVYCSLCQFKPHLNLFPREKILFPHAGMKLSYKCASAWQCTRARLNDNFYDPAFKILCLQLCCSEALT